MMRIGEGREEVIDRKILGIGGIILCLVGMATLLYALIPELKPDERADLVLPRNLDQAKRLGILLSKYKDEHFYTVIFGIATVYILLQSFAIPGSIFLSILSGYLFPFPIALLLVCTCSACGAQVCYFLSHLLGRQLIMTYIPERVQKWQNEIASVDNYLFFYMVFLRVTPLLPNWFINIASPIVDVPASVFFFGTFFGVAPPSFIFIQAGTTLQMMTSTGVVWSYSAISMMVFSAFVSLLPICYQQYCRLTARKQSEKIL
uniref:Transmembrane protein 41B n=2 Tax=Ascaris TaxID=6251 RepID=A0A0M3HUU2_ASCLU